ncbi:hypothetical protein RB200_28635 [Streptomyces sp. PmtG]
MRLVPRFAAALSGATLALGGLAVVAPAAHATPQACQSHVFERYPDADREAVRLACLRGADGDPISYRHCYIELSDLGVVSNVASEACLRAARP